MGIVPTWEGAHYLPSIVGRSSALRIQTTAPIITAQEAKDLGFVDVIYEKDEEFEELVASMLKNGADVCKAQKAMIDATEKGEEAKLGFLSTSGPPGAPDGGARLLLFDFDFFFFFAALFEFVETYFSPAAAELPEEDPEGASPRPGPGA
ncbi:unnamed protein product [Cylicostephanus goldi]|uniref:Uncharacterized protein n=1 Tax=Cylicostephanus goldi TaxID=71465 RepID=A0A3P6R096_CYLGO|nr:unnamed protein product [Cylicostephanus goldi]